MKRMQPVILLLAAMTLFLFYKHFFRQNSTQGITRAQTARMLAWTVCDMNENLLMLTAICGMPMK